MLEVGSWHHDGVMCHASIPHGKEMPCQVANNTMENTCKQSHAPYYDTI